MKNFFLIIFLCTVINIRSEYEKDKYIYIAEYVESYDYYTESNCPHRLIDKTVNEKLYFSYQVDDSGLLEVALFYPDGIYEKYSITIIESFFDKQMEINTNTLTHEIFAKCLQPCWSYLLLIPKLVCMDLFILDKNLKVAVCNHTREGDGVDIYKIVSCEDIEEYRKKHK